MLKEIRDVTDVKYLKVHNESKSKLRFMKD